MKNWQNKRINNANEIWNSRKSCKGLIVPKIPNNIQHAAYKCYIFIKSKELKKGWSRDKILNEIMKLYNPLKATVKVRKFELPIDTPLEFVEVEMTKESDV